MPNLRGHSGACLECFRKRTTNLVRTADLWVEISTGTSGMRSSNAKHSTVTFGTPALLKFLHQHTLPRLLQRIRM